jgi:hypothetical protein
MGAVGEPKGAEMLRLIFTVCMIDAPATCEQREMLVYDRMPVMACVTGAMPELATWRQTHPNWRIARWRCENDGAARLGGDAGNLAGHVPPASGAEATAPGAVPVAISR